MGKRDTLSWGDQQDRAGEHSACQSFQGRLETSFPAFNLSLSPRSSVFSLFKINIFSSAYNSCVVIKQLQRSKALGGSFGTFKEL